MNLFFRFTLLSRLRPHPLFSRTRWPSWGPSPIPTTLICLPLAPEQSVRFLGSTTASLSILGLFPHLPLGRRLSTGSSHWQLKATASLSLWSSTEHNNESTWL